MTSAVLPDGLAAMPPGPGLAAALGTVELGLVPNDRMLEILRAQHRQLCHEQARMAAVLAEVGRCERVFEPGEVARMGEPDEYSSEEARAALRWTRRAADAEHELADTVVHTMPLVFTAWLAGQIDRPRVTVFERYLLGLTPAQITRICAIAVPKAPTLTTGQLAALLRRMVIAVDPDAAERWYRKGIRERNVTAVVAHDGTVVMSANGLPADDAEAACVRLQELAEDAQRAGHPGLIGQIRCDLFLGLLDGRFHHMTREQVVDTLIADYLRDGQEPAGPVPDQSRNAAAATGSGDPAAHPASGADTDPTEQPVPDERVGIEIRVALSTLLGHDDHPGEIPGVGPLLAPDARARVALQGRAEWRFAVIDADGRLVADGITRRRPTSVHRDGPRGGVVEIQVPASLLEQLATGAAAAGEWVAVVADIAHQYAQRDDHRQERDAHPKDRLPRTALRRHNEIRDRSCVFPGCRHSAHRSEQDHTRDHEHGGDTVAANLGPMCPHDHDVKHRGNWKISQPEPGIFDWHSPLGGRYRTHGESFLPQMPEPEPVELDDVIDITGLVIDGPILLPRPPPPPEPPPPPPDDTEEAPPF